MRMRILLIAIAIALVAFGCNKKNGDGKKIGVMFSNLNEQRFQNENAIMEQYLKNRNCTYLLKNANNDPAEQERQFDDLLSEGIDALIVSVVDNTVGKSIIKKARENGIKTIMYDGFIGSNYLDYCVRFSDKEVGRMMAAFALEHVPEGNYLILGGDGRNENAPLIRNGIMEILAPAIATLKVKVVFNNYIEEWNAENVYYTLKDYINLSANEKIDAIILSSDNMATGAIRAIEEANYADWPLITGQDGSLTACRSILQGKQAMSVLKDSKKIAEQTAQMALQCANGETPETNGLTPAKAKTGMIEIPTYFIELEVVKKSNIPELIKRGIHSKELLGL